MDIIDPNTLAAEAVSAKGAALTAVYNSATYPHDWTEGTGTLGASGLITVPSQVPTLNDGVMSKTQRKWWLVQNQSAGTIEVQYEARLANGTTQSWITLLLVPGASAGTQGSSDERGFSAFVPQGIIKVSGAANAQVAVAEVVE
jgi:hypothetical protein